MISSSADKFIGILGSGFGLYGYLPAVALNSNNRIALLQQYQSKFSARPELQSFTDRISWVDEGTLYTQVNQLIICLSPGGQVTMGELALNQPNIKHLILEKPLAANPALSHKLLAALSQSGKTYRIGYNFQYTNWGKLLLDFFNHTNPLHIKIQWDFLAHHFANDLKNWKRYHSTGGGVIRFYGIHLIALLACAKQCQVIVSSSLGYTNDEIYRWTAGFEINNIHTLEIEINSAAPVNQFTVSVNEATIQKIKINLEGPFDEYAPVSGNLDKRLGVITSVLTSLQDTNQHYWNNLYNSVNNLWQSVEDANAFTL